ncbi:DUF302 domain-containing protein [Mesorhizobium sp. B2-3-5]|uniref:DUF302 domain-containing protein n=1 Tax=Mesorhizobium sp. B2-3-5 TaxID=2589958 RepID=UPI00112A6A91|nr:DUF302 domain-containing protein [Mesorhizobium sp. B2-3-5]TPM36013.1 DUF302 domain-containing protein [Mesorhizobium sp. B2-3-5]
MAGDGLITVQSRFGVTETINRMAEAVKRAGLRVFARIDHAAGARDVDAALRPTELLIFGNPKGGTPLMQDRQLAGIDLPVKALAWEDEEGKVWLSYNDANWIAGRHGLGDASRAAVVAMAAGMEKVIASAAGMDQS